MGGRLGCLHPLVTVNSIALSSCCVPGAGGRMFSFLFGQFLGVELLGHTRTRVSPHRHHQSRYRKPEGWSPVWLAGTEASAGAQLSLLQKLITLGKKRSFGPEGSEVSPLVFLPIPTDYSPVTVASLGHQLSLALSLCRHHLFIF